MIYMAAPYSHPNQLVCERRYQLTLLAAVRLTKREGCLVYAPTVYGHQLHTHPEATVGGTWAAWAELDRVMIRACDRFAVLALPGWDDSHGIEVETAFAIQLDHIIEMVLPADLGLPNA